MSLRRLAVTAVLALSLATTGCVTANVPADLPSAPPAAEPSGTGPAGLAPTVTAWPSPMQAPGRQGLATTVPERTVKATPRRPKPAGGTVRRGRAAAEVQQPVLRRTRPARPRPDAAPPQRRPRVVAPRQDVPRGAPSMRQLCRQSSGVTSADLTQLCRSTYGG